MARTRGRRLQISDREIDSVFGLLGEDERDITFALGFGLSRSDALLRRFLEAVGAWETDPSEFAIDLERYQRGPDGAVVSGGRTDIELRSAASYVIVEAKNGWNVPSLTQLATYQDRLDSDFCEDKRFVVLTQQESKGSWHSPCLRSSPGTRSLRSRSPRLLDSRAKPDAKRDGETGAI